MIILFSQPGRNWELHLPMMKACSSPIIPGLKLPYLLNSTPVSWTVSTLYAFLTDASWCISAWCPKLLCYYLITGGLQVDSIIVYIKRSVQQTAVSCAEVGASLVTRTGPWLTGSGFFPHLFWDRSHQWTPYGDRYFGWSFVVCPGSPIGWSRLHLLYSKAAWSMVAVCETVKMRRLLDISFQVPAASDLAWSRTAHDATVGSHVFLWIFLDPTCLPAGPLFCSWCYGEIWPTCRCVFCKREN